MRATFRSERDVSMLKSTASKYGVALRQNIFNNKPPKKYIIYAYGERAVIESFLKDEGLEATEWKV